MEPVYHQPPIIETKVCLHCRTEKPLAGFRRVARNRDGRSGSCHACARTRDRRKREEIDARGDRECGGCGQTKPGDDFHFGQTQCKSCHKDRTAKPGYKEKVRARERSDKYVAAKNNARYQRKYGVTLEQVIAMRDAQGHACPICGRKTSLVLDHCHRTKKVRALLCDRCNRALGAVDDDVELMRAMIEYVEKHAVNAPRVAGIGGGDVPDVDPAQRRPTARRRSGGPAPAPRPSRSPCSP